MPRLKATPKPSLAVQLLQSVNDAHGLLKQSLDALAEAQAQIRIVLEAKYERPVIAEEQARLEPNTGIDIESLADTVDYGQDEDAAAIADQNKQADLATQAFELALEHSFEELAQEHAESHEAVQA